MRLNIGIKKTYITIIYNFYAEIVKYLYAREIYKKYIYKLIGNK